MSAENKELHPNELFDALAIEAAKISNLLTESSDKIIEIEEILRDDMRIFIPFKHQVYINSDYVRLFLSWEKDRSKSNDFRIYASTEYRDDLNKKEEFFKKALVECDIKTRLEFIPYLDSFIIEYTKFLSNYRKNIEDKLNVPTSQRAERAL